MASQTTNNSRNKQLNLPFLFLCYSLINHEMTLRNIDKFRNKLWTFNSLVTPENIFSYISSGEVMDFTISLRTENLEYRQYEQNSAAVHWKSAHLSQCLIISNSSGLSKKTGLLPPRKGTHRSAFYGTLSWWGDPDVLPSNLSGALTWCGFGAEKTLLASALPTITVILADINFNISV